MDYFDHRFLQRYYQERLKEAEHARRVRAISRAQRQATGDERPASRLPRFLRLFGRRPAGAGSA